MVSHHPHNHRTTIIIIIIIIILTLAASTELAYAEMTSPSDTPQKDSSVMISRKVRKLQTRTHGSVIIIIIIIIIILLILIIIVIIVIIVIIIIIIIIITIITIIIIIIIIPPYRSGSGLSLTMKYMMSPNRIGPTMFGSAWRTRPLPSTKL
jgi:hypothetical protein